MTAMASCSDNSIKDQVESLARLLDTAPDLIFRLNRKLQILYVNQEVVNVTGLSKDQYLGKTNRELQMPEALCNLWDEAFLAVFRDYQPQEREFVFTSTSGPRHYQMRVVPEKASDGSVETAVGITRDITDYVRTREALKEREKRLKLATGAAQLGVFDWDVQSDTPTWENERMYEIFGLVHGSEPVNLADLVKDVMHPDDLSRFEDELKESMKQGGFLTGPYRVRRVNDGQWRWVEYFAKFELGLEGNPIRLVGVLQDITERKQAEVELKKAHEDLQKRTVELEKAYDQRDYLSRRLVDLLERERTEVGYALQEEIAQILAGVSMQLEEWKRIPTETGSTMAERVERVQAHLRDAMKQAKGLSTNLRSESLEKFGLLPSIEGLVGEVRRNSDINIRLFSGELPEDLEDDKGLTIYRLVQEGLTNILKHADAKNVFVNLTARDGKISLTIEDDGIGFNYDTAEERRKASREHLGITIMRERTAMVGGRFEIDSTPGKGVHMLAEIPISETRC